MVSQIQTPVRHSVCKFYLYAQKLCLLRHTLTSFQTPDLLEIMEMTAIAHLSTVEHQTPLLTSSKASSANIEVIRNAHMCSIMHVILFKYFVIFHTFYISTYVTSITAPYDYKGDTFCGINVNR